MPKSIILEPEKLLAPGPHPLHRHRSQRLQQDDRRGTWTSIRSRTSSPSGRTCAPSASSRPSSTRSRSRASTRASTTTTSARPTSPSGRRPRRSAWPSRSRPTTTSSARTAATARFSPRASPPSASSSDDRAARHHALLPRRRHPRARSKKATRGTRAGTGRQVPGLRRLQRDLRARNRLQPRPRRLDARLLRALRHLSEQRHRGRLGLHRAGRGAVQARQPQARHRRRQHRRRLLRLRPGLGRHHLRQHGPVPHAVGSGSWAAACPSSSTA